MSENIASKKHQLLLCKIDCTLASHDVQNLNFPVILNFVQVVWQHSSFPQYTSILSNSLPEMQILRIISWFFYHLSRVDLELFLSSSLCQVSVSYPGYFWIRLSFIFVFPIFQTDIPIYAPKGSARFDHFCDTFSEMRQWLICEVNETSYWRQYNSQPRTMNIKSHFEYITRNLV